MNAPHPARTASRVLGAGALLIALVWAVSPVPSPPLYDGLQAPPEPYRYLAPPPGSPQTPAPGSATKALTVSGGTVPAAFLTTDEQPPQAQLLVGDGTLVAPTGAHTVTLGIKPVPLPAPLPPVLGHIAGNVYDITATADTGGDATLKPGATPPTVVLRGPSGSKATQIARLAPDGSWSRLQTVPLGNGVADMLAANTSGLGYFAMVTPAGGGTTSSSGITSGGGGGGSFPIVAVIVPLAAVLVLAGLLVAIRLSRARATGGSTTPRGGGRGRR